MLRHADWAAMAANIKCGNESWQSGGIVTIKVELERNLQIPKSRREVSNTENCCRPLFSAITRLRVTDLLAQ